VPLARNSVEVEKHDIVSPLLPSNSPSDSPKQDSKNTCISNRNSANYSSDLKVPRASERREFRDEARKEH
jgi:hypothetical protein